MLKLRGKLVAAVLVVVFVLLAGSCFLRINGERIWSGWLLAICPLIMCGAILLDFSHGGGRLGQAAIEDDRKRLEYCLGLLVLSVVAAMRPNWSWLFWFVWILQTLIAAILVYIVLFWKVFQ